MGKKQISGYMIFAKDDINNEVSHVCSTRDEGWALDIKSLLEQEFDSHYRFMVVTVTDEKEE